MLRKCSRDYKPTDKAYLSEVTNISNSFTHKMAAKTSWHRYNVGLWNEITSLSPYVYDIGPTVGKELTDKKFPS